MSQLRDENGALIGGLDVLQYNDGFTDKMAGLPPRDIESASYDLGRQRAAERMAEKAEVKAKIMRDTEDGLRRMREILSPDAYQEYEKKILEIWTTARSKSEISKPE